jgi:nucleotide-binding universal stress UspA family protein
MREILVAVDLGPGTAALLDAAAALAGPEVRIHLVHVASPDPDFVGYEAGPPSVRDGVALELRDEHRALEALVADARGRGLDASGRLLRGPTVEVLLAEAERIGAALSIVGRHARRPLVEALVGSTARGLLRHSRLPVLVVPPPQA